MKKSILLTAVVAILSLAGFQKSFAQTKKIGHVALSEIVQLLPEKAAADTAYARFSAELEKEYYAMEAEVNAMIKEHTEKNTTWSPEMRKIKEEKIQVKQQELQVFAQQTIQTELQEKQYKLTLPLIEKVEKAVKEVAKEKGYSYVFDRSEGQMLVWDDLDALDPDVKKKLGISLTATVPGTTGTGSPR